MQRRHEPTIKTKSAALLAAEAAFAPPRQTAEQLFDRVSPRITVLRAKGVPAPVNRTDSGPCSASDSATPGGPQLSMPKAPRVFLLTAKSGSTPSEWPLRERQAEEAGPAALAGVGLGNVESTPMRRARRSRRRPPPVTLVFSAIAAAGDGAAQLPTDQGHVPAMEAQAQGDPTARRSASLAAALAEIEPTFAAISLAMRLMVDDPQMAVQWQRLSRALDQIAVEIRTSSPTAIF